MPVSWTQHARNAKLPREERGAGKNKLPFNGAFRHEIRLGHEPQNLLFVECEYPSYDHGFDVLVPFWERPRHNFVEMRNGRRFFRSFLCPRGKDRSIPCKACELQYDEKDARISTRRTQYFVVISLEWHLLETNQYGDENYHLESSLTPVEQRRLIANGAKRVFGRHGYLALGPGHATHLLEIIKEVEGQCASCVIPGERGNKLHYSKFNCDSCGHTLQDMETTELTKKQIDEYPNRYATCPSCGHKGLPAVEYECSVCDNPVPANLFDVVIPLAKRGQNTDSRLLVPQGKVVDFVNNFVVPVDDLGGEDVAWDEEAGQWCESLMALYKPIDFHSIFEAELNPEYQNERIFNNS